MFGVIHIETTRANSRDKLCMKFQIKKTVAGKVLLRKIWQSYISGDGVLSLSLLNMRYTHRLWLVEHKQRANIDTFAPSRPPRTVSVCFLLIHACTACQIYASCALIRERLVSSKLCISHANGPSK